MIMSPENHTLGSLPQRADLKRKGGWAIASPLPLKPPPPPKKLEALSVRLQAKVDGQKRQNALYSSTTW